MDNVAGSAQRHNPPAQPLSPHFLINLVRSDSR